MLKLTQLLNKRIYDVSTDRPLGLLKNIMIDKREKRCLISTDGDVYAVDSIIFEGDEIRVTNAIQTFPSSALTVEKQVYDVNGKYLGRINDVEIGKTATFKITVSNGETYSKSRIRAVDDVVIINNPSAPKRKKEKQNKDKTVGKEETQKPLTESSKRLYPAKRRYGDFSFLIGKTVDKNIKNFYGEIMIRNGEKITLDTFRQAKVSGKLVELCLHSK